MRAAFPRDRSQTKPKNQSYQIFWEVVVLERGPLSLVSTTEELLGWKTSGSGLGNREYGCRDPSRWPHGTLYPQKLALTSPTSGGRSIGIVYFTLLLLSLEQFYVFVPFYATDPMDSPGSWNIRFEAERRACHDLQTIYQSCAKRLTRACVTGALTYWTQ
jgi:hypothetical protein